MRRYPTPTPTPAAATARLAVTATALAVLAACGGGGGGGGGGAPGPVATTAPGTPSPFTPSDPSAPSTPSTPSTPSAPATPSVPSSPTPSPGPKALAPGPNGSYLFVSAPDFYFGTLDVGTVATQVIELVNRGGDIYPINSLSVTGDNPEEFTTDLRDPVTLNPSEKVRVSVTFAPIDAGRKFAELDIDFDTIVQVDAATNINEQTYYRARELEDRGDYQGSLDAYSDYVANRPVTVNKQRAAIKVPVIEEAAAYGAGEDFELYLAAMNARDDGDSAAATNAIDTLLVQHEESYLADDALYLKAYIDLVDRGDDAGALESLEALRERYPDTTYHDAALYAEALAQHELGNQASARATLLELRRRHTGLDVFGILLPKDNLLSRLWFKRANAQLEEMTSV